MQIDDILQNQHRYIKVIRVMKLNKFIRQSVLIICILTPELLLGANAATVASNGMVVSQNYLASEVGIDIMMRGGNAIDSAVATAFALAVTHPTAGNIGGGGFLVYRPDEGEPICYDFREMAPKGSFPEMWLVDGVYDSKKHHHSYWSVGIPGTVAGLYLAWQEHGKLPWKDLVKPASDLAQKGIVVTHGLSASIKGVLPRMSKYPASVAKFTNHGVPYEAGEIWKQPDLAASLKRIASNGPDGFYKGKTAELLVAEMKANGGLITLEDLADYEPKKRNPIRGSYRGYQIISMPPPSSGGTTLVEMLNILEAFNLKETGFGSADTLHIMTEAMRRAYEDRAKYLGDPDFTNDMPLERLLSKRYAAQLGSSIDMNHASLSSPEQSEQSKESEETTHFSVVDKERNAVSLTYTLEFGYGSGIVVPGAGFLLNNEMGDFNAGPGLTNDQGLIGTPANLAEPGKRMLSSMTPTILEKDGELFMVTGTPGGRTIINTVMQTILNVIDHEMNAQAAVDSGRIHHQWMPDQISYETHGFSPDTLKELERRGHVLKERPNQGSAEVIIHRIEDGLLEGGVDGRRPDGGVAIW